MTLATTYDDNDDGDDDDNDDDNNNDDDDNDDDDATYYATLHCTYQSCRAHFLHLHLGNELEVLINALTGRLLQLLGQTWVRGDREGRGDIGLGVIEGVRGWVGGGGKGGGGEGGG